MNVDLSQLGPDAFERLCQALTVPVLGPGVIVFGDGPDGGREASVDGQLGSYPGQSAPWDGYVVMQVKYKSTLLGTGADAAWLRTQIKKELDAWADPATARVRDGRRPEYLIFATNVVLSAVPGRGSKDRIDQLIRNYAAAVGLKDHRVWDGTQIITYLDAYPQVRRAFAALITPSEVLAQLLDGMTASPASADVRPSPPRFRPGQSGHEAVFEPAYQAAGGTACLGEALGEVQEDGPGWVQHFAGGPRGEPAVLCALFGQPVVAVARTVWNEVCTIGRGGPTSGITAVGFPVVAPTSGDTETPRFISAEDPVVDLAGGTWTRSGRSQLVRRSEPPLWQPSIVFDREAFRDRDAWTHPTDTKDLRMRVAARIPLIAEEWRITNAGRTRLEAALDGCGLDSVLQDLARRYGLTSTATGWTEIDEPNGHNNGRFASYHLIVPGADGCPALTACAYLMLPDGLTTAIQAIVDVRVEFAAIDPPNPHRAARTPVDIRAAHRLTRTELVTCLTHAWHTATTVLPLAAAQTPQSLPPAGAPRLEFYIQSERPGDQGEERVVRTLDMIDLSDLGVPRRGDIRTFSIAVTTPQHLTRSQIADTVEEALVRMAEDAGFAPTSAAGYTAPAP